MLTVIIHRIDNLFFHNRAWRYVVFFSHITLVNLPFTQVNSDQGQDDCYQQRTSYSKTHNQAICQEKETYPGKMVVIIE